MQSNFAVTALPMPRPHYELKLPNSQTIDTSVRRLHQNMDMVHIPEVLQ